MIVQGRMLVIPAKRVIPNIFGDSIQFVEEIAIGTSKKAASQIAKRLGFESWIGLLDQSIRPSGWRVG